MSSSCTLLLLAVAVALLARPAAAWSRQLQADNCTDSPGANRPQECTNGFLGIGGNQWDNNEIECHVCTNSTTETYQLKCNLNFKITSNNTIDCELDQGPLHSAIKFSCDAGLSSSCLPWLSDLKHLPACTGHHRRFSAAEGHIAG
ncbi:hypothetical protein COHA_004280 [Chlorella ohadii]|uniref:Cyanovirin-N domain-containing protein n=1 Tax=Chlorella ohadii TaxID=2649997 RepID=A0AAD5DU18_9CHLO|nr:hypothetical protein COHA_004280 [Chlorella ohadii]